MAQIPEILRQLMVAEGGISFARFMETALYCPKSGYYERAAVGRAGDFYTSVSVGGVFGALLGCQVADWLEALPAGPVQVMEAGAHDGTLAADLLDWWRANRPELSPRLAYWILEPSAARRQIQRTRLAEFAGQVHWFAEWGEMPEAGIHGVILSNELLDAFPVHRLAWDAGSRHWREWGVSWLDGRFVWARMADEAADWSSVLVEAGFELPEALLAVLPHGFTLELSPAAAAWWREAAGRLRAGRLLTFDYGASALELLSPSRAKGTLRAYRQHRLAENPLADPGEQDLTAHVNFTQIQRAGEAAGLRTEALVSQGDFLTRIATRLWRLDAAESRAGVPPAPAAAQLRQFQTLVHPEHLGMRFRVLVQRRPAGGG